MTWWWDKHNAGFLLEIEARCAIDNEAKTVSVWPLRYPCGPVWRAFPIVVAEGDRETRLQLLVVHRKIGFE